MRTDSIRTAAAFMAVAAGLFVAGCSTRDFFTWQKPDFGREYKSIKDAKAATEPVRNLKLSTQQLTALPPEVPTFTALERLSLRGNQLDGLPAGIEGLAKLYWLDIGENKVTTLDAPFTNLSALRYLYLNDNAVTNLSPSIAGLRNLRYLNLDRNKLTCLPPEIGALRELRWLRLNNNAIEKIPDEIKNLSGNLQRLYLRGNKLSPEEQARIKQLLPGCKLIF